MEKQTKGRVIGMIVPRGRGAMPQVERPRVWLPAPLRLVARPDTLTATVVECGLDIYFQRGQIEAIDFFTSHGVPLRTISRVLWRPELRRGYRD